MDQNHGCKIGLAIKKWINMMVMAINKWINMMVVRLVLAMENGSKSWFWPSKMDQHDDCKIGFSHGEWIEMLVLAIKQ